MILYNHVFGEDPLHKFHLEDFHNNNIVTLYI